MTKHKAQTSSTGLLGLFVIGSLLLAALSACGSASATPEPTPVDGTEPPATEPPTSEPTAVEGLPDTAARDGMYDAPPEMQLDPAKYYVATLETAKGDIVLELFGDKVPVTVNSFVFLAREGFYDDTTFHRVIPGFMAQAGDPTGTGLGGPGYPFPDEFDQTLNHDRVGILSMANSGPGTNGSQFFITFGPTSWLDGRHTVFGRVIGGLDVLASLGPRDPETATTPGELIKTIRITESDEPAVSQLPSNDEIPIPESSEARNAMYFQPPEMLIDPGKSYVATIKTPQGDIVVELNAAAAPVTVNNFVFLARQGFYDGLLFHRVEPEFVIQGGDPTGTGQGGPGYVLPAEIGLPHVEGAIAMARLGDQRNPRRMSSGSQFYITLAQTAMLDGAYTVFGKVSAGMDVVNSIAIGDTIESITIAEK